MCMHSPLQGSPVPLAPFPGPCVANTLPPSVPPRCPCTCLPRALYLSQGSYYGTFHNAPKEDQVQFCGPCGIGEGSQVVQDLLHGWGEGTGSETHTGDSWAQKANTHHSSSIPRTPRPTEDSPYPAALPSLPGMGIPGAEAPAGGFLGLFIGPR